MLRLSDYDGKFLPAGYLTAYKASNANPEGLLLFLEGIGERVIRTAIVSGGHVEMTTASGYAVFACGKVEAIKHS